MSWQLLQGVRCHRPYAPGMGYHPPRDPERGKGENEREGKKQQNACIGKLIKLVDQVLG